MKENVIDVLMFLFDNYLGMDGIPEDEIALASELAEAGFQPKTINKAFDWLGELAELRDSQSKSTRIISQAMRVYLPQEQHKLNTACRGFLYQLETLGLLDIDMREMIIDRAMAIEVDRLSLKQFKRIVGLVMLNGGCPEEAVSWVEDLLYEETAATLH